MSSSELSFWKAFNIEIESILNNHVQKLIIFSPKSKPVEWQCIFKKEKK